MYDGKRILGIIPARGGSKGVPRKNIRELAGKPLIAWTIEEAKKSNYLDKVILSSEDSEIISVARAWGCDVPFVRPAELARDETPGIEPVLHALRSLHEHFNYVVLLQPTSPLRRAEDIDRCIEICISRKAPACVSVSVPEKNPYWMYTLDGQGRMHPVLKDASFHRRQDLPKVFALNGAVYVADCEWLGKSRSFLTEETLACEMPRARSLDIDSEWDLRFCELMLQEEQIKRA